MSERGGPRGGEAGAVGDQGVPIRNVWHMLLYAWDLAVLGDRFHAATEAAPDLVALLTRVLLEATRPLLARGLARRHHTRLACVSGVRGRIDFPATLGGLHLMAGRTVCHVPAMDRDTPQTRILRATLHWLGREPALAREAGGTLRAEAAALADTLADVPLQAVSVRAFARLQMGRADRAALLPLSICRLLAEVSLPTESGGDRLARSLLRDETRFRALFERFVRNLLHARLTAHDVAVERLTWPDELGSPLVPTMTTDITVTERAPQGRRLIIDTKFSARALERTRFGSERFRTPNLYQLYAYLQTQSGRGPAYASAAGLLLYPAVGDERCDAMRVQGHTIRVATVDLAAPWPAIEARIIALVHSAHD